MGSWFNEARPSETYETYFSDRPVYRNPLPVYLQRGQIDIRGLQGYSAKYIPRYTGPELVPQEARRILVPQCKSISSIMEAAVSGLKKDLTETSREHFLGVGIAARFLTALEVVQQDWMTETLAPTNESRIISITKQPGHESIVAYEQGLFVSPSRTTYRKDDNRKYGPLVYEPTRLSEVPFDELTALGDIYKTSQ